MIRKVKMPFLSPEIKDIERYDEIILNKEDVNRSRRRHSFVSRYEGRWVSKVYTEYNFVTKEPTLIGRIPEEFVAGRLSCSQRWSKILMTTDLVIKLWEELGHDGRWHRTWTAINTEWQNSFHSMTNATTPRRGLCKIGGQHQNDTRTVLAGADNENPKHMNRKLIFWSTLATVTASAWP
jgi:hypothetical protein